ncbi:hypothetical protein ACQKP0_02875 [Heyndrickxia sp. NPDC080065]|uniref:hypothetical protein n=1 Tax=Heyndrickxia sp. NPDC080065 TaxID=3390568 RepID=UPI003CFCBB66
MKIFKVTTGVIILILSIYALISKDFEILRFPFIQYIVGVVLVMIFVAGISEILGKRKRVFVGLFYIIVFTFILHVSIQAPMWPKSIKEIVPFLVIIFAFGFPITIVYMVVSRFKNKNLLR